MFKRWWVPVLGATTLAMAACAGRSRSISRDDGSAGKETGWGGTSNSDGAAGKSGHVPLGGAANAGAAGGGGNASAGVGGEPSPGASGRSGAGGAGSEPPGCQGEQSWSSDLDACAGDFVHRRVAGSCTLSPHEFSGEAGAGGESGAGGRGGSTSCRDDADCAEHPNGYCIWYSEPGAGEGTACVYACRTDSECRSGEVCACTAQALSATSRSPLSLGECRPAECKVDSDCGGGWLCVAPLHDACEAEGPTSFHCQTAGDECAGRDDCPADGANGSYVCRYELSRFVCVAPFTC